MKGFNVLEATVEDYNYGAGDKIGLVGGLGQYLFSQVGSNVRITFTNNPDDWAAIINNANAFQLTLIDIIDPVG
ncbi:hypothetical protein [Gloeothece citriformis]|uniref:hypothetical protein n=1 Tax=Gloeothece citriformis TaxID=2546356 RepID=UPI00059D33F6|nr:hypothetical protein [Gloeothece citriformis]